MDVFAEGIGAISQACTLALLIPACAVALLAGRHALAATAAFLFSATVVAWARFSDNWFSTPSGVIALLVGLAVIAAVLVAWKKQRAELAGPAGAVIGFATGWLWEPCVGLHLAGVINKAPNDGLSALWGTMLYIVGASLVAVALATARHAFPKLANIQRVTAGAGAVAGTLIGLTMAVGAYDDVVAELVLRSRP